jgi:hypothetical protein
MSDDNTTQAEKRTRTSPRVKFADELCTALDTMVAEFQKQTEGANKTTTALLTAKCEVLTDLRNRVVEMANDGPSNGEYAGHHYIGKRTNGELVAFDSNAVPTKRTFGTESKHGFTAVWGPQRTKAGQAYRIEHPDMLNETAPIFS